MEATRSVAAAAPAVSAGWLRGPGFDVALLVGPLALGILAAGVVVARPDLFGLVLGIDLALLGYPHVVATYSRLYVDPAGRRAHRLLAWAAPPAVLLATVGLAERRQTPAHALSGGQQKRVSIAIELLSRPQILFLDEVTSGLDMKTEREMMELFRELAAEGITIFCITHHLESLDTCHHIAYFFKGKLAFFGPEPAFRRHFDIEHASHVYGREEGADPSAWHQHYALSPTGQRLLTGRLDSLRDAQKDAEEGVALAAEHSRLSAERTGVQTASLTRRFSRSSRKSSSASRAGSSTRASRRGCTRSDSASGDLIISSASGRSWSVHIPSCTSSSRAVDR